MKKYRVFKIITIVILILGLSIEFFLLFDALIEALNNRSLAGGGRAQSEFFLMGLFFVGRPVGFIGLFLWLVNLIIDLLYKGSKIKRNELIYIGLTIMTLLPFFIDELLLNIMYSGWN